MGVWRQRSTRVEICATNKYGRFLEFMATGQKELTCFMGTQLEATSTVTS